MIFKKKTLKEKSLEVLHKTLSKYDLLNKEYHMSLMPYGQISRETPLYKVTFYNRKTKTLSFKPITIVKGEVLVSDTLIVEPISVIYDNIDFDYYQSRRCPLYSYDYNDPRDIEQFICIYSVGDFDWIKKSFNYYDEAKEYIGCTVRVKAGVTPFFSHSDDSLWYKSKQFDGGEYVEIVDVVSGNDRRLIMLSDISYKHFKPSNYHHVVIKYKNEIFRIHPYGTIVY